jgi:hypothetical protein
MIMIKATGIIHILADSKSVFSYISNLENDKFWRKEINRTTMTTSPQLDARAIEDSYLSKRTPSNILHLRCIEFVENKRIVYQTLPDSRFFLKSTREVEQILQNESRVLYSVEFDKSIVRHGLGFPLPTFLVAIVANCDLKKYLNKLKAIFENINTKT